MNGESATSMSKRNAFLAIAVGAVGGGTVVACVREGWDIPLYISAGLLGMRAVDGGAGIWLLGVFLHFVIAFSAASIYYLSSRRLPFLTEYPLLCGLFFGAAVQEVMNLVVLPLSGLHARGPYHLDGLIRGLVVHMLLIGVPIAYSVRRFARYSKRGLPKT